MNPIVKLLIDNEKFNQYMSSVKNKLSPISLSGLSDVGKEHIIAGTVIDGQLPACIITYNEIQAKKIVKDLAYFCGEYVPILYLPKKEISPYDYVSQGKELAFARMETLNRIYNSNKMVVVTTIEAIMQKMPSKELLYKNIISFKVGCVYKLTNNKEIQKYSLEELRQVLIRLGYERNELVEAIGQFSIRGGIVDIGLTENKGVRIEFWGDEVDSIRYFNIASQRSSEMTDQITIYPAHEYLIGEDESKSKICDKIQQEYDGVEADIEIIKNGDYISKIDKYFNEFYEKTETLINYLPDNCLIFFDEMGKINQRRENIIIENNNLIKSLTEKERFVPEAIENISNGEFVSSNWEETSINKQTIYMQTSSAYTNINKFEFNYREINFYKSEAEILVEDIKKWMAEGKSILLLAGGEANVEKICNMLKQSDIECKPVPSAPNWRDNACPYCATGALSAGVEAYDLNLVVVSLAEAFENTTKKKKSVSVFKQSEKIVFADLKPGDYVVHKEHGIGQFVGVNTIEADGVTKDYIKIKYKDDDVLYVPTNSLDNVRKYIGAGDTSSPKVNKLGSKEWYNAKERVKKNLREVAKDLIELYAKRQKIKGFAFSQDTDWQRQFEDNFPYQETDDQLKCIEEVKSDMEKSKPMDRLLCGDVGYGKTEVAIRAAFKAVMDQKQVAYLVPTTILANQQYEEFKRRMEEDFAIKVELLNRFRTKKEQDNVIRGLKLGEVDVVIGTHRLLSKDVEFKDLGLLIIDEEQRFGVKSKEKIKQLKNNIDVLTMTATPIPRTLHMSIVGVRDMSVIYEPPQNRRPVQTYVLDYDNEVIKEAITKELERDGQVFYLYNTVENIDKKAADISRLVPEAKVDFAHGKMSGKELEAIMESFINKESNVLVCTTILESGIDIPNANTIIVENADRLGLSQLYQIRGRVGRSNKQAYAYITYKRDKLLNEVADKRLKAIKEFTEFGSGFKIAMRDLEIRGAGSLLGEIQHGHMEQVGYDTYCKLLEQVVQEMQGIEVQEEQDVQIDINISSYIPDSYIENGSQKIEVYQNIALCRSEEDIQNVIDEIIDRYGVMPEELENLIEIARIKQLCREASVAKVSNKAGNIVVYFQKNKYNPNIVDKLLQKYQFNIKFSNGIEPYITLQAKNAKGDKLIEQIKEFLNFVIDSLKV